MQLKRGEDMRLPAKTLHMKTDEDIISFPSQKKEEGTAELEPDIGSLRLTVKRLF